MTASEKSAHRQRVAELKIAPTTPLKAIRQICFECQGGSWHTVKTCEETACANWPFRLGVNPFRKTQDARTIMITNLSANQKSTGESPVANAQDVKTGKGRAKSGKTQQRRMVVFEGDIAEVNQKLDKIMEKLTS